MNVLLEALNSMQDVMPHQDITIINSTFTQSNGFPVETISDTITTKASIQPMSPYETARLTDATIGASNLYNFWILGDLANVKTALNKESSVITWGSRKFKIFSIADWTQNGWIQVIGTEVKNV